MRRRTTSRFALAVAVAFAGTSCELGDGASSDGTSVTTVAITTMAQLPDPCTLVAQASIDESLGFTVAPVGSEPVFAGSVEKLFRTCTWGDSDGPLGAIGIQIGVPDATGSDVVARRSSALQPGLATDIGEDGTEAVNVGEMPTGGGLGSSIYFRHRGYSVLIGIVGEPATIGIVEALAAEIIDALDATAVSD